MIRVGSVSELNLRCQRGRASLHDRISNPPWLTAVPFSIFDYGDCPRSNFWRIDGVRSLVLLGMTAARFVPSCRQLQIIKWQSLGSFFISPFITWPRSMW